ncbi:hypothetical protein HOP50_17g80150 [Chloropicon primus]|uniref:Uncharacterized protein n=1 Tax=Chloropicon primus TaxID=1764295 RepID=A0A5B8N0N8_9CHLO|nr:hypothetical protein A3770_17p79930 [Chloropicon primus]UPR04671.1 hypothetical protein HOP50_17g80150 [Chloropicon primus]|mmetsp:Transcript_40/g.97  ORF Transcript_40/g.97 Transcript_40/m.97 type:complete len:259 (+) Transcript_40:1087-1863(+)|eukprot:QDZ25475.1 hypothetical protein A3770_17p79930 [Chloropicon primus]
MTPPSYSSTYEEVDREPHRQRILALSQRLETLQANLELDSQKRTEALEVKLLHAEERIVEVGQQETAVSRDVQTEVYGIEKLIGEEREEREALLSRYLGGIKTLQQNLAHELKEVTISRKESEAYVSKVLDEATGSLRAEFVKEMGLLDEARRDMATVAEKDLPLLQEKLNRLKSERDGMEARVARKRQDVTNRLKTAILEEKHLREELEEAILRMLSDIAEHLQKELEGEKKERDTTEESLISVLEQTCEKLQVSQT